MEKFFQQITGLAREAELLSARGIVQRTPYGFCINRFHCLNEIERLVVSFNRAAEVLKKELPLHEADFNRLRIELLLAKLRTYIGLARISDFFISESQWNEWFRAELDLHLHELKSWLKEVSFFNNEVAKNTLNKELNLCK